MIKLKNLLSEAIRKEGGPGSGRKAGIYTSASKPRPKPGSKPPKAPKLKQFGETAGDEDGERLDEAPSGAAIASALDAIRSEARHKDIDIQRWLHPHLRKIENALRKFNRSGS